MDLVIHLDLATTFATIVSLITTISFTITVVSFVGMWLPYSPLAAALGFTQLPPLYWPLLFVTLICYAVLTQIVKMWLIRKRSL